MPLPSCICVAGKPPMERLDDIFCALAGEDVPVGEFAVDLLFTFENGAVGDPINAAYLNANQIGADPWTWTQDRVPEQSVVGGFNMPLITPVTVNGVDYDGTGTRSWRFDLTNGAPFDVFTGTPSALHTEVLLSGVFKIDPTAATSIACDFWNIAGGSYVVFQYVYPSFFGGAGGDVHVETQVLGVTYKSTSILLSPNEEYQWSLLYDGNSNLCELVIVDSNGELVGTSARSQCDISGPISYIKPQTYIFFDGGEASFDNVSIALGVNAVLPKFNFTMPNPTNVFAEQQLSGQVTLTWDTKCTWFKIERATNGGAFVTLEPQIYFWELPNNFLGQARYVDSTVVNGTSVVYRVTNHIGSTHVSSSAVSNSVVVDNGSAPVAFDQFIYTNATFLGQPGSDSESAWEPISDFVTVERSSLLLPGSCWGGGATHGCAKSKAVCNANHRSVAKCVSLSPGSFRFGAATVRCQTGVATFYMFQTDGTNWFLFDIIGGSAPHVFASGTSAIGNGDYISLEANGTGAATRLTAKKIIGGVTTTIVNNADPGASHYIDGGAFGIGGQGGTSSIGVMGDWKGYNL